MKTSGVYKITSTVHPERIYVGSAVDISERWRVHLRHLKKGRHHSILLQRHVNKYGLSDIQFSVITICAKEDLLKVEQVFIDGYKPYFNIAIVAGSPMLGRKASEEAKAKMSKSKMGNKNKLGYKTSDEHKKAISESLFGHKPSEEAKSKMSESAKGRVASEIAKLRMRKSWIIRRLTPVSEETKIKMSESTKRLWRERRAV